MQRRSEAELESNNINFESKRIKRIKEWKIQGCENAGRVESEFR
jgi:hypothetical protein